MPQSVAAIGSVAPLWERKGSMTGQRLAHMTFGSE